MLTRSVLPQVIGELVVLRPQLQKLSLSQPEQNRTNISLESFLMEPESDVTEILASNPSLGIKKCSGSLD